MMCNFFKTAKGTDQLYLAANQKFD